MNHYVPTYIQKCRTWILQVKWTPQILNNITQDKYPLTTPFNFQEQKFAKIPTYYYHDLQWFVNVSIINRILKELASIETMCQILTLLSRSIIKILGLFLHAHLSNIVLQHKPSRIISERIAFCNLRSIARLHEELIFINTSNFSSFGYLHKKTQNCILNLKFSTTKWNCNYQPQHTLSGHQQGSNASEWRLKDTSHR